MKRFEVTWKRRLNDNMVWLKIYAPLVAKHAKPGQFIILRTDEFGERIPLTMAGHNEEDGTIDLIYAAVGRTTMLMDQLEVGDCFADIVGPLGKPTHMDGLKRVCVVGGGTGNALAYPLACGMHKHGVETVMIAGFKTKDLVILEDEFRAGVDELRYGILRRHAAGRALPLSSVRRRRGLPDGQYLGRCHQYRHAGEVPQMQCLFPQGV